MATILSIWARTKTPTGSVFTLILLLLKTGMLRTKNSMVETLTSRLSPLEVLEISTS